MCSLGGVWFLIFVSNIIRKVWVCSLKRNDDIFNDTCLYIKDLPHLICGWHVDSEEVYEGHLVFHGEMRQNFDL